MIPRFYKKSKLISGYYGFSNFGDDLFPLAAVEWMKKTEGQTRIAVVSPPIPGVDALHIVPGALSAYYSSPKLIGKF